MVEFGAQNGEGFDQARNVFWRADGPGVEDERVVDAVTIEDLAVVLAIGRLPGERRIGRAVDGTYALGGQMQDVFDVPFRGLRYRNDTRGTKGAAAVLFFTQGLADVAA